MDIKSQKEAEFRILYIDIAKGISILLVAIHHSYIVSFMPSVSETLGLFRVPFFFFISGVLFSSRSDTKSLFTAKSDALLKPYLVTLCSLILVASIFKVDPLRPKLEFLGILYGTGESIRWTPLWFLPHLFLTQCFCTILIKKTNMGEKPHWHILPVLLAALTIFGHIIAIAPTVKLPTDTDYIEFVGLPFSADLLPISATFYILGFVFKEKSRNFRPNTSILIISMVLFIFTALYTNAKIDLHSRIYNDPILSSLAAFCGIYLVLGISYILSAGPNAVYLVFKHLGRNSLVILLLHGATGSISYHLLSKLTNYQWELSCATLSYGMSIVLPLAAGEIIKRSDLLSLVLFPVRWNPIVRKVKNIRN